MIEATYTVQPADSQQGLLGIAQQFYGDSNRWLTIYLANRAVIGHDPNVVQAGQHLVIPNLSARRRGTARIYVVQPADTAEGLSGIAERFYNDSSAWPRIYEANRGVIGHDPHCLQAGQHLVIP